MGLEEQKRVIENQIGVCEREIRLFREQKERFEEQVRKIKHQIDAMDEKIQGLEKCRPVDLRRRVAAHRRALAESAGGAEFIRARAARPKFSNLSIQRRANL